MADNEIVELLTPMQRRIFQAVYVAGWPGITRFEIASAIYRDDINGGKADISTIKAHIWKINKRLRSKGVRISAGRTRESRYGDGLYQIIET